MTGLNHVRKLAAFAVALSVASPAFATVLPFNESGFGSGGLAVYGDRVTAPTQSGATYLVGQGWTPNIELNFVSLGGFGPVSVWSFGYASLQNALGHGNFNVPFRLEFVADPGWLVTLHGFDLATWSNTGYQTDIRIWDDNGSFTAPNLFSLNTFFAHSTVYQPLPAPVTGVGTLNFYISNIGSTGLDNISFSQSVIPEPAAASLLVPAVVALTRRSRR